MDAGRRTDAVSRSAPAICAASIRPEGPRSHVSDGGETSQLRPCRHGPPDAPSLRCERPDLRLTLRIGVLTELHLHAAGDGGHLVAGLEAGEVRTVPPRPRAAKLHAGFDGRVVHDVDLALVIRIALLVARKISEIAARSEDRMNA